MSTTCQLPPPPASKALPKQTAPPFYQILYNVALGFWGHPPPDSVDFLPVVRKLRINKGNSGEASCLVPPDDAITLDLLYLTPDEVEANSAGTQIGTVTWAAGSLVGHVWIEEDRVIERGGQLRLATPETEDENFSDPRVVIAIYHD